MIDYNEDRRQLQVDRMIEDFIAECEERAKKLEVTDYYIAEFLSNKHMTHTIHKSNNNSGCGGFLFLSLLYSFLCFFLSHICGLNMITIKNAEQLQTILKNECGMVYSIDEVARNGENLSTHLRIKENND